MRTSFAVLACFVAAGCVSTKAYRLDDTVRPARSPETLAILAAPPSQPHTVIAVIESKSGTVFDSFDDLREQLVARAAHLGADAVILGPEVTEAHFIFTGYAMIRSEERRLRCRAIVYGGEKGIQGEVDTF